MSVVARKESQGDEMYILTNGEGYVFQNQRGINVLHEDELVDVVEEIRELANDESRIFVYRLVAAEEEFNALSKNVTLKPR